MYEILLKTGAKDIKLRFELWQEAQNFIKSILNNCDEKIDISITKINNLDLKTIGRDDARTEVWSVKDTDFND